MQPCAHTVRTHTCTHLRCVHAACPANVHVRMRRERDRLHLVGVAIAERRRWARVRARNC